MIDLNEFLSKPPYSWLAAEKNSRLIQALNQLRNHHMAHCQSYRRIDRLFNRQNSCGTLESFPYLPVRMFKEYSLFSVPDNELFKTMTSSGTSGQAVSRIFLDKGTSILQTHALAAILKDFIGKNRLPMVIIDTKSILRDPKTFSARGAGILGVSNFGRDHFYALNDDMTLDVDGLLSYIAKYTEDRILFFGFTFMVWLHFCEEMDRRGFTLKLENAILIHAGGWKKLAELAVTNQAFKARLRRLCGDIQVHNFYGMVEQTGSIYMECEEGHFHASNFSQIIIRDIVTHEELPFRTHGLIETISVLPWSYPGFALLTEDTGEVLGEDDCNCGRKGRYFTFHARLPKAEIRGCSDTYAADRKN